MGGLRRDTALVFDLENVVEGYGNGLGARLERISVPDIVGRITEVGRERGLITEYAVKRAYADWSRSQLAVLRRVLVEQGIEPRQIFAFGSGGKTNAADIELVIDVLELAYTRPEITTFVVVSGDGGFGTLVRKLHEFGKTVVVGAYKQRAARGLRAVADEFIELDPAVISVEPPQAPPVLAPPPAAATASKKGSRLKPEQVEAALAGAYPEPVAVVDELPAAALALVERLAADPVIAEEMTEQGLNMGPLVKCLAEHLDRTTIEASFGSFTKLLRFALADSPWCVASKPGAAVVLGPRATPPGGREALESIPMPGPVDQLREAMKVRRVLLPEDPRDLWMVAEAVAEAPVEGEEPATKLLERLLQCESLADIEVAALRQSLIVLAKAGALTSEGSGPFPDWSFSQPHTDVARSVTQVRELVRAMAEPGTDGALIDDLLGLTEAPPQLAGG